MRNKADNPDRRFNFKMGIVLSVVLVLGVACLLRIFYLMLFQRTLYTGTSEKCLDKTQEGWEESPLAQDTTCNCYVVANNVRPVRGEIYDDQNRVLVSNVTVFDLTIDGRTFERSLKKVNRGAHPISEAQQKQWVVELSQAFYQHFKNKFPKYDQKYYEKKFTASLLNYRNALILQSNVAREDQWITSEDTAFINHLPLLGVDSLNRCVNYTFNTVRINPYGDLARRTLGMNANGREYGIEYYFNDYLAGHEGSRKYLFVNNARLPLDKYVEPVDGYDVHSTINIEIQYIVHNELKSKLVELHAEWGCAIVMETKTGEIKAITNLRRNGKDSTDYTESYEYALHAMVEPGSTFKLASALAYLNKTGGKDSKIYPMAYNEFKRTDKNGVQRVYPKTDGHGNIQEWGTPIEVFQRSSNVGIASMIFDAYGNFGYADYLKAVNDLFITTSFATQLGKLQAPNFKTKAKDFHTYYNTCYGAGFSMTPMQTLVYYNAVANNGKMLAPLFVKYTTRAHESDTLQKFQTEVIRERICDQKIIDTVKKYMEAVVVGEHGTARYAQDPTFTFAGKTGTRDIWDEQLKKYVYYKNSASFCGYFPADNPKYTCLVFMYNVSCKGTTAAKVFAGIAKNIMNMTNYAAMRTINQEKGTRLPYTCVVNAERYEFIMQSLGIDYPKEKVTTPYVSSAWTSNNNVTLKNPKFKSTDKIPNVENMIAADAVSELTRAGYKVKIFGYGVVRRQEYFSKEHTVVLTLQP